MKRLTLSGSKRFSQLLKKGIKKPKAYNELFSALLYRRSSEIKEWRNLYSNKDVQSFRIWLKRIHDPENSHRLKEGYKSSAISNHVGFMTTAI